MANLIIKKVVYNGDKYSFDSPEFTSGLNIIVGDNGSGKSTFSFLIEYAFGANIKYFDRSEKEHHVLADDINNYVQLNISINNIDYFLKRYIGLNDIFVLESGKSESERFPIYRQEDSGNMIFSDWILEKLNIKVYELYLGARSFYIGFLDLFRLLHYDQYTEPGKIYKNPPQTENFVNNSLIIRKSIFETLLGVSSENFNLNFNLLKNAQKEYDEANSALKRFKETHGELEEDSVSLEEEISLVNNEIEDIFRERDYYQKSSIVYDKKIENINILQSEVNTLEVSISENRVKLYNLNIEKEKLSNLLINLEDEIRVIENIQFTNEKLNLFSLEKCPFCGSFDVEHRQGLCICGNPINNDKYEKFLYNQNEYVPILKQKNSSKRTLQKGLSLLDKDIQATEYNLNVDIQSADKKKNELEDTISKIEFSGNSQFVDQLNNKILEKNKSLVAIEEIRKLVIEKEKLQEDEKNKKKLLGFANGKYTKAELEFLNENKSLVSKFSDIYNKLMKGSSCECKSAEIDADYMPVIDGGVYKEKSAFVAIRMMYYFAFFYMGLNYSKVKHPKFLLIDTPEDSGIDKNNLDQNLLQMKKIFELSNPVIELDNSHGFQLILTSGYEKYPKEYDKYVRLRLLKEKGDFLLKNKN